ncbi:hypothetical protein [Georgenia thermotolerans]|uniref:hypothetical protein n=1 Tax=Georgenia thermotolerans TaxID=527326 RepID=UPI0012646946|nr:hypothetical protein [Georgenia thermotolerans]
MTLEQDFRRALTGEVGARVARGQVEQDDAGVLRVVIEGARPPVRALGRPNLRVGDAVGCIRIGDQWYVLGASTDQLAPTPARPSTGRVTAVTAGAKTITLTAGGVTHQSPFLGVWSPTVGQDVTLLWPEDDTVPVALGPIGQVPAPAPAPTPEVPPAPTNPATPAPESGWTWFTATDSGTMNQNNNWNASTGRAVRQGSGYGLTGQGAWWYGTKPSDTLRGRTITRMQIRLPARERIGNYNAAVTFHFYLHDQASRGGRPARLDGPHNHALSAGYRGGDMIDLPASWGQHIVNNGGGITIWGDPYAGLVGVGAAFEGLDPASGQIVLDWTR